MRSEDVFVQFGSKLTVCPGQSLSNATPQVGPGGDQLGMFRTAASFSDDGRVSYVVANAGIARADDVFSYSGTVAAPDLSSCA